LAKYIYGTSNYAVFVINIEAIKDGIKQYGGQIEDQLEMTVLHELAHAIQDGMNFELDEDEAEDFAFSYQFSGILNKFWEDTPEFG